MYDFFLIRSRKSLEKLLTSRLKIVNNYETGIGNYKTNN
jgi:hypothetical protein